ncbi:MAG: hypothetical protein CND89_01830 [Marine Group II euryarchaeote MED-G38]|uniref:Uncharacterized protein n=1 Tax=uncultured Poseidoniia archaeon TaxID=1697135 RepID=A0A1B1TC22_9ARCH|nr:hypothetical protein [uncultured Candidatus Thalassoarchaea sp.]PDH23530.1 MAG: hypothetical protein CND89_01830 [Marine Group II euryarchaeote MED-G38]
MKIARHRLVAENLIDLYNLIDSVILKTKLEYPKLNVEFDDHITNLYTGFNPHYDHEEGWSTCVIINQVNESLA